ncbi:hypothetical protein [Brevundimonas sp. FT23028]|uniref:hypothetical protein n=1 Tax=Brevundimonas sp. FT23028 TaxID=3393748 RepID=UPI003B5894D2
MQMYKLDDILKRFSEELLKAAVTDRLLAKQSDWIDFFQYKQKNTINTYRHREKSMGVDVIPYGKILPVCVEFDLDINYIFKG